MDGLVPAADRIVTSTDNQAPSLKDILESETEEMRVRALVLVDQIDKSKYDSEDNVEKCVVLAGIVRDHLRAMRNWHKDRKEPFLEGGRAVDNLYNRLCALLVINDGKGRMVGGPLNTLMSGIDEYRAEVDRIAAENAARLEEEARKAREAEEAAERARQEAEAKAAAATTELEASQAREAELKAELDARRAQAAAEKLEKQAVSAAAPQPIRTAYGVSASARTTPKVTLDADIRRALMHALTVDPDAIRACVQTIYDKQARAGVRALPGATVTMVKSTVIRT